MTTRLKCYIIDDDPHAVQLLAEHVSELPQLELAGSYQDPIMALTELQTSEEEMILLLDVDMPKISGLQLATQLRSSRRHVIFTTAHSKYALPAWALNAAQFLLKPFDSSDFYIAVSHALDKIQTARSSANADYFFIRTGERGVLTKILKSELVYIQGAQNYVDLFLRENRYTVYLMLKEIEELLCTDPNFYRVHRSYIINMKYVDKMDGNLIYLNNKEHKVTMSGDYRTQFQRHLNTRILVSERL